MAGRGEGDGGMGFVGGFSAEAKVDGELQSLIPAVGGEVCGFDAAGQFVQEEWVTLCFQRGDGARGFDREGGLDGSGDFRYAGKARVGEVFEDGGAVLCLCCRGGDEAEDGGGEAHVVFMLAGTACGLGVKTNRLT